MSTRSKLDAGVTEADEAEALAIIERLDRELPRKRVEPKTEKQKR